MRKFTFLFAILAACALCFSSCDDKETSDGDIDFQLLFDRMWVPDYFARHRDMIPELATDSDYPIYFDRDAKRVVVLHAAEEEYSVYASLDVQIDKSKRLVKFIGKTDQFVVHISRLTNYNMTLYFESDEDNFVCYKSAELPAGKI